MSTSKLSAAILALAALHSPTANAACTADPAEAAKNFYRLHQDFYYAEPGSIKDILAPRLLMALKRDHACAQGEVCAIETVPWTAAQDGDVGKPITFTIVEKSAAKAAVDMRYTFVGPKQKPQHVQLKFERSGPEACWLVSDLIQPDGKSLLNEIEQWHKEFGTGH